MISLQKFLGLAVILSATTALHAFAFDGVRVANIEKHNGNYSGCSTAPSGDYAYFRFRLPSGVLSEYYVVPVSASASYKDMLSMALTSMTSGLTVNVRGNEVAICGAAGTLTMMNLVGN
jgi:hypothetical protein